MSANRKFNNGSFSANGFVPSGSRIEYTEQSNHSGLVLFIMTVVLVAVLVFVSNVIKTHAMSSRIDTAGNCNGLVNHSESAVYVTGSYTCQYVTQSGLKSDYMVPEETSYNDEGVNNTSRKNKDSDDNAPAAPATVPTDDTPEQQDAPIVESNDNTPPADQQNDTPPADSENGNPGNNKPVGNAGEKCEKDMCENGDGTGEHGKSDND